LLNAGGMSYHKTEKVNPKRDENQVQAQRDQNELPRRKRYCWRMQMKRILRKNG
jgi:hypothetical protein